MATQRERYNATYTVEFGDSHVTIIHATAGRATWHDDSAARLRSLLAHVAEPAAVADDYFNGRESEWAAAAPGVE